jgi:hypothetical protein
MILLITRRPSAGWGPSRLSTNHCANWIGEIGPSLRWGDGVFGLKVAL